MLNSFDRDGIHAQHTPQGIRLTIGDTWIESLDYACMDYLISAINAWLYGATTLAEADGAHLGIYIANEQALLIRTVPTADFQAVVTGARADWVALLAWITEHPAITMKGASA